jgi:acetolactate synthase-1/3 small subunit
MNHIALLMENQPGALSRVIGLFSQRGYNIDSLSVAPTQDETLSRLTMTIGEEGADINQILKQLYKLVDVVMVQNLSEADSLTLELAIIKLNKAKTVVEGVFKVLGDTQEIEKLLSELKKEEFLEVTRSGTLGITKGNESLATNDQTKISYD